MFGEEVEDFSYTPTLVTRSGPDPEEVGKVAKVLMEAKSPVIYVGQGVHYAEAWPQLKRLAEMLAIPVMSSLGGKSAFPENHPLSLGTGGIAMSLPLHEFLHKADVVLE